MNEPDKTDMNMQQKITPHLWFDDYAQEAAKFYTSIFKNSRIIDITHYGKSAAEVAGRQHLATEVVKCRWTMVISLQGWIMMHISGWN